MSDPKFLRLELHNHTDESDASLDCRALLDHMLADGADGFALTDHNTISGHAKMRRLLEESGAPIAFIPGMEYTTYYGHILGLCLERYLSWENIDPQNPEKLFLRLREAGALAGIAHPYSYGHPFARGCRFDMVVRDYSAVDFIEIFNNLEPLHEVNEPALRLWEERTLGGDRLAATCGMDLHGPWDFAGHYATYIEACGNEDICTALTRAVRSQSTQVSRGILLLPRVDTEAGTLSFSLLDQKKKGCTRLPDSRYRIVLKSPSATLHIAPGEVLPIEDRLRPVLIAELYEDEVKTEHLVCVGAVLRL